MSVIKIEFGHVYKTALFRIYTYVKDDSSVSTTLSNNKKKKVILHIKLTSIILTAI